ncbi:hypothetical protein [Halorussus salinus]|uniref:hypothetical protein n=1 Tax=Halorussus salinus TaxID=1364935 RepID=UPI00138F0215|nr:hypothetical protein [Halorussus salinus]
MKSDTAATLAVVAPICARDEDRRRLGRTRSALPATNHRQTLGDATDARRRNRRGG